MDTHSFIISMFLLEVLTTKVSLYLINNKHEVSKLDIIGSFFYIEELLNINNVHFHADM